jgi:hypothetical protein
MKNTSEKNVTNKFNLKNGLAFAYRAGNFLENSIGRTIADSSLAAPVLDGDPLPRTWYRINIPSGISGDGSGYYIYLKKGISDHLCIFFSGGGVAWNEYTAARPVTGGKVAAGMPNYYWNNLRPFTQIMNIHIGITDTNNPMNPFNDWNFIIVTYATGDFHVGNNEFPYTAEDGSQQIVHFSGFKNFMAAMSVSASYFPDPDRLLIAGDSAGAFAVPALAGDIIGKIYPSCNDITLFSDSGQLNYHHWRHTARDIWKADDALWRSIRTTNLTMDWYRDLYRRYGSRLRYLYASSTHDYLLSAYFNDITFKKYDTDDDVQAVFYHQLQDMVHSFKEMSPDSGIFINDWKNIAVIKPGLRGGTVHTAVRQLNFYTPSRSGVSMARWLSDAVSGVVYDVGAELL